MVEQLTWNTGAWYTEHGQRFIAIKEGPTVKFMDYDRGLSGTFEVVPEVTLTKRMVMQRYDGERIPGQDVQRRYDYTHLSYSDYPEVFKSGWEKEVSMFGDYLRKLDRNRPDWREEADMQDMVKQEQEYLAK